MKKLLLTFTGALAVSAMFAQPSTSWTITQNAAFPLPSAGTRFLDAVTPNDVWAIGYDGTAPGKNYNWFSKTNNGGTTWTSGNIYQDTNTYVLANLEGIDGSTAWVSAYMKLTQTKGAIHRTTDGGATWVNMTAAGMYTNAAAFTNIVTFLTPLVGITQGDPNGTGNEFEIWRTVDGGNNWTKIPGSAIPNPLSGEFGLVNVYTKQGTSNLWFGTNEGRVYRSTDGGLTWNVSTAAPGGSFVNDIAFTDPNNGVIYVNNAGTFEMYNTTNGGATWTQLTVSPNVGQNDISVVPNTNYLVSAGAGTGNTIISYSNDNGVTWTDWGSIGIQYLTIDFADNVSGWSGSFSDPANSTIGGIWKYNGAAITSTVPPTSGFILPANLCFNGTLATVTPTDMSTGTGPLTYSWSSQAGVSFATSTSSAPAISFTAAGTYTITLDVTNAFGFNSSSQIINVLACTAPTASFSVPTNTLCQKVAINFTNTSSGTPTPTYSWSTSPAANVTISPNAGATNASITFSTPGTYSVTLWASNASGTAQTTQTITVSNCAPNAGFNMPVAGCTGAGVTMTNTSTGATSYSWSASPTPGNISNVSAPNPTITFANAGTYTVTLTASNVSGPTVVTNTISVSTCVGLNENSIANGIHVFPNPAKDLLNVEVLNSDIYSVTVTNILGKVILTDKSSKDKMSIDLSNVTAGIYFLTIDSKGQKTTKKIIVE